MYKYLHPISKIAGFRVFWRGQHVPNKHLKIIFHAFLGRVNEYQGSWKLEPIKNNFKQILGWGGLIDFLSLE